jgi:alanine dehydrogenase
VHGVIHYCVANMPGAVPNTSTYALNNVVLPFAINIANLGYKEALRQDPNLRRGLNVCKGKVTYQEVATYLNYDYIPPEEALGII